MKKVKILGFLAVLVLMFTACFGNKSKDVYKEVNDVLNATKAEAMDRDVYFKAINASTQDELRMAEAMYDLIKANVEKADYTEETIELQMTRKDGKLDKESYDVFLFLNTITGLGAGNVPSFIGM